MFPNDVYEDGLAAAVKAATPVIRATQANANEIAVELVFDRGLVHIQNKPPGKRSNASMHIRVEQSPTGQNNWTTVVDTTVTGCQTPPLYWGWRWRSTALGTQQASKQYDIRVSNLTGDQDEDRNFGNFTWYSLKPVPAVQ